MDGRSRPPHRIGSDATHASRVAAVLVAASLLAACAPAARAQDPNRTATIFVGGFASDGASQHRVFGVDGSEALLDSIAALVGVPVAHGEATLPPNVAADMKYYGTRRRPTTVTPTSPSWRASPRSGAGACRATRSSSPGTHAS